MVDIVDVRGYTALHMACFKNNTDLVQTLLEKAREFVPPKRMKEWVNAKT